MGFPLLDWSQIFSHLLNVALAYVLALPLGWERERSTSGPGLHTFPLVAIASCGYILIARSVIGIGADEQSRVLQGLLSGIGFIGGGAILKEGGERHRHRHRRQPVEHRGDRHGGRLRAL